MRMRMMVLTLFALVTAGASTMSGQARPQRSGQMAPRTQAERDTLEQQVRRRMGQILKTQLRLTDDQMQRLQATNLRFEARRRALLQAERDVRLELRAAMRGADSARTSGEEAPRDAARDATIARLLDRMIAVQRDRVDLLEEEQRELAAFLTPEQRARYFGMEEQIRRRMTEMRDDDRRRPAPVSPGRGGVRRPGGRPPVDGS